MGCYEIPSGSAHTSVTTRWEMLVILKPWLFPTVVHLEPSKRPMISGQRFQMSGKFLNCTAFSGSERWHSIMLLHHLYELFLTRTSQWDSDIPCSVPDVIFSNHAEGRKLLILYHVILNGTVVETLSKLKNNAHFIFFFLFLCVSFLNARV